MKKTIRRSLLGFPMGIVLGNLITILISLKWGDGHYYPCSSELVRAMGSEINAVVLQMVLCGVLGAVFAASSMIWEKDDWSLVKQTGIYFLITSAVIFPIAYFSYWMEHSVRGFLIYFGIFLLVFIIIWILNFIVGRNNIIRMNEKLHEKN